VELVSGCSVNGAGKLENPVPKLVLFPNNSNTDAVIALYRHALQQRLATNAFFYTQMDRFLQQQNQLETLTSLYREGIEQYSAVPPQAGKEHFKQHFYGQLAQLFLEQKQPEKAIALY